MIKLQPPEIFNLLQQILGLNRQYSNEVILTQQILQLNRNDIFVIFVHSSSNLLDAKWIGDLKSLHLSLKISRA